MTQQKGKMEMKLYANPYNQDLSGFYFETLEEYTIKLNTYKKLHSAYEHSIDAIDGSDDELELFKALSVDAGNIDEFFDNLETFEGLNTLERIAVFYLIEIGNSDPFGNYKDVIVSNQTLEEYTKDLFFELYEIPDHLAPYIDTDKFANERKNSGDVIEYNDYLICNANEF